MKGKMIMKKESCLRKFASGMGFILLLVSVVTLQIPGTVIAAEETNMNRGTSVLEGKVMKYQFYEAVLVEGKSSGDEKPAPISQTVPGIWSPTGEVIVELRFGHLTCSWTTIKGDPPFDKTGRQPCIQVEMAPDVYQVIWMEPNADPFTMIINLEKKRVLTSYRHKPGPTLELLGGRILKFGSIPGTVIAAEETNMNSGTSALEGKVMKYQFYEAVLIDAKSSGDEKPFVLAEDVLGNEDEQFPYSQGAPGIWAPMREITEEIRFGHLACSWTGINDDGSFGHTGTRPCIQVEIEPDIYMVLWMEPHGETVTMTINVKTKRMYSSYRHGYSPAPVRMELLGARILGFGPASEMGYGR